MNSFVILFLLALYDASHGKEVKIEDRVRYLKETLQRELRQKHRQRVTLEPLDDFKELASYEVDNNPITPIMSNDALKRDDKFKLRKLKTTTDSAPSEKLPIVHQKAEHKPAHKALRIAPGVSKPLHIFYRRAFSDKNTVIPWLHCSELITPYIQGAKKELTRPRIVDVKDHIVVRLTQLLNMNTTSLNKDEVYSILYQISKLKIRLWSWSTAALRMLFNIISRSDEKHHSFRTIKEGLKALFSAWKLDTSNTTRLLLQARVFRPPCMYHEHIGSSRLVRGSTISIITTTRDTQESDGDCNNRAHNHG